MVRRRAGLFLLLLIVVFAFLIYDGNTRLVTEEFILEYGNLPAAFNGYRLVQLSDIHAAVFGAGNRKLLEAVEKARPNSIVITGDLVSYSDTLDTVYDVVLPLVRSLKTIAPVYYVTGNHEWDNDNVRTLLKLLVQNGVTVLRNDYVRLTLGENAIILAGVDDPNGPRDMKTPEALIGEIRRAEGDPFIVLLAHRNKYLDRFSSLDIDLVLCGHAHGGVIRLPFAGGLIGPALELFPDYTDGVYTKGNTKMLVSRGIGNGTGVPRFLNNPQIAVAVLRAA
jgi:predicted MPP superfamily phosphohydrolase